MTAPRPGPEGWPRANRSRTSIAPSSSIRNSVPASEYSRRAHELASVALAPQIVGSVRASEAPTPVILLDPVSVALRRRDHPSSAATALLVWGTSAHICGRWRSPRLPPAHPTRPSSPSSESVPSTYSPHRSGRTRAHVCVGSACLWSHVGKASWRVDSFVLERSDPLIETP